MDIHNAKVVGRSSKSMKAMAKMLNVEIPIENSSDGTTPDAARAARNGTTQPLSRGARNKSCACVAHASSMNQGFEKAQNLHR